MEDRLQQHWRRNDGTSLGQLGMPLIPDLQWRFLGREASENFPLGLPVINPRLSITALGRIIDRWLMISKLLMLSRRNFGSNMICMESRATKA